MRGEKRLKAGGLALRVAAILTMRKRWKTAQVMKRKVSKKFREIEALRARSSKGKKTKAKKASEGLLPLIGYSRPSRS